MTTWICSQLCYEQGRGVLCFAIGQIFISPFRPLQAGYQAGTHASLRGVRERKKEKTLYSLLAHIVMRIEKRERERENDRDTTQGLIELIVASPLINAEVP